MNQARFLTTCTPGNLGSGRTVPLVVFGTLGCGSPNSSCLVDRLLEREQRALGMDGGRDLGAADG